jgi:rare lipoprotein A
MLLESQVAELETAMHALKIVVFFFFLTLHSIALAEAQEGMASYYADSLQGNLTASEQPYDKDAMTAAHRTLAFGTRVRVSNLDNGKSVEVVINDRGPHSQKRIIDVSGAAARQLGLMDSGTALVRIDVLEK